MRRAALLAFVLAANAAHAESIENLGRKIVTLEGDAQSLERGLRAPKPQTRTEDIAARRLVDAQVAYGMKNWADAAILLYDIVEKQPNSRAYREAVFYLADALFRKGDYLSSREYFKRIVTEFGERDAHYQESLQRLVELSLRLRDPAGVEDWLARLSRVPKGANLDAATYVRGKYAYFSGKPDEALQIFGGIGKGSQYFFQARYFMATAYIAKQELAPAAKILAELLREPVKTPSDKRVVELAHLALGRIHYEREQLSEAVDQYLMVSRRSNLFDDALYEVAWVYVKAKQFDKALRALELLALANPKSAKLPEVRILEGNLRIRKAQAISEDQAGNSTEEYAKAQETFERTRDAFAKPREDLKRIMDAQADPSIFFAQITGQSMEAFDTQVRLPEVAIEWARQEPDVRRVVNVTKDLVKIRQELEESGQLLDRLDRAVASPSRVQIFPELASRRSKANEILAGVTQIRAQAMTEGERIAGKFASDGEKAELANLRARREQLEKQLATSMVGSGSYEQRVQKVRQAFVDMDKKAQELDVFISSIDAEMAALEKYWKDTHAGPDQKAAEAQWKKESAGLRRELEDLRRELDAIRNETQAGQDEAGLSDADAEKSTRAQFESTVRAEAEAIQRITSRASGDDRRNADQIASVLARCSGVDRIVDRANVKIDALVDAELGEIKVALVEERTRLNEYRQTLATYEGENVQLGGEVITGSFASVADKFYQITVRADLGVVDVAWAQKEETKEHRDRLNLDQAREKKVLMESFREATEEPPPDDQAEAVPEGL
jgi:tetratricopeptide (TPR) repeat protein